MTDKPDEIAEAFDRLAEIAYYTSETRDAWDTLHRALTAAQAENTKLRAQLAERGETQP